MNKKKVAERLISLRGNITQKVLAEKLGIAQSTYAMYELGERMPSDEKKKKIADYYHTTVQAIFFAE